MHSVAADNAARTFVLLDRDGTLIIDRDYLNDPAGVELLPNTIAGLRRLRELGCGLVVTTNQSGIGRGRITLENLAAIHARMNAMFAAEGLALDGIYFCPHVDEDHCECRKPKPGMALQSAREHGFDLARAYVIGDRDADVGLGHNAGATSILVRTGDGLRTEQRAESRPDHIADDLLAAAEWIAARLTRS